MRVVDIMMGTPYHCQPANNLGVAAELMWKGNCGFLPVVDAGGRVVGVVTDRDICIALGTRGRASGDVQVAEVMSTDVRMCAPEDDAHTALSVMRDGRIRRLPVVTKDGNLVGVVSVDDILLRTSDGTGAISSEQAVSAFRAINARNLSLVTCKRAAT